VKNQPRHDSHLVRDPWREFGGCLGTPTAGTTQEKKQEIRKSNPHDPYVRYVGA
jgi:hypothetical protein